MNTKKDVKQGHKDDLLEVLTLAAKDRRLFDAFLRDILTPAEYREIAERWQIIKQLEQGSTQRDISRDLGVAIGTVTRGSRILENPTGGVNQMIQKLLLRK